jgi:hypothetical protein
MRFSVTLSGMPWPQELPGALAERRSEVSFHADNHNFAHR